MKDKDLKVILKDGDILRTRITDNLLGRFDRAIETEGLYSNRSETVRSLIIQYIKKIEASQ